MGEKPEGKFVGGPDEAKAVLESLRDSVRSREDPGDTDEEISEDED